MITWTPRVYWKALEEPRANAIAELSDRAKDE
jgi:hypothetical protein